MRTRLVIDTRNILDHERWATRFCRPVLETVYSSVQPVPTGEIVPPASVYPTDTAQSIAPTSPPSLTLLTQNGREGFI